jgi:hypothetical protein
MSVAVAPRLRVIPGDRRPRLITIRRTDALAPVLEAIAFCDEVIGAACRLDMAAVAGSRAAILNEAGRLGHRAQQSRAEFRRLAARIDGDGAA